MNNLAYKIHKKFKSMPASNHIASEYAIKGLVKIIKQFKPKIILEVGVGIGTLTYTIVKSKVELEIIYDEFIALEGKEEFYKLSKNYLVANNLLQHLKLLNTFNMPKTDKKFDLVVIDGGILDSNYYSQINDGGIVFVEGFMDKTRKLLLDVNKNRKICYTNYRLGYQDGYWVFYFEPSIKLKIICFINNQINRFRGKIKFLFK